MPCLYYLYDYSPNLLGTEETTKGRQKKMDSASADLRTAHNCYLDSASADLGTAHNCIYLEQAPLITIPS